MGLGNTLTAWRVHLAWSPVHLLQDHCCACLNFHFITATLFFIEVCAAQRVCFPKRCQTDLLREAEGAAAQPTPWTRGLGIRDSRIPFPVPGGCEPSGLSRQSGLLQNANNEDLP